MSRLMSLLTLLLLLFAAQPASGVVRVSEENRAPEFFAEEPTHVWGMPPSNQYGTRESAGRSYEFASDVCDGPNLYAYVGNGPTMFSDILGLEPWAGYANGPVNELDLPAFHARALQGAGTQSRVFTFNSPATLMDALRAAKDITRLDLHGHGAFGMLYTGDTNNRILESDFDKLAEEIASGKIDVRPGAHIRIFACYGAMNAAMLAGKLGELGRGDISVTGSRDPVGPNEGETFANGYFLTYKGSSLFKNAKKSKTMSYK